MYVTSVSSNTLAAFVEFGIMCPYMILYISLSEESLAAQLQEKWKLLNMKKQATGLEIQSGKGKQGGGFLWSKHKIRNYETDCSGDVTITGKTPIQKHHIKMC